MAGGRLRSGEECRVLTRLILSGQMNGKERRIWMKDL